MYLTTKKYEKISGVKKLAKFNLWTIAVNGKYCMLAVVNFLHDFDGFISGE